MYPAKYGTIYSVSAKVSLCSFQYLFLIHTLTNCLRHPPYPMTCQESKIRSVGVGVQLGSLGMVATDWPIVACPGWLWWWRIWWNEDWQGKPKYSEKTRPSATLSTTNPTWPDPGSNPGHCSGKPATNRLSYGASSTRKVSSKWLRLNLSPLMTLCWPLLHLQSKKWSSLHHNSQWCNIYYVSWKYEILGLYVFSDAPSQCTQHTPKCMYTSCIGVEQRFPEELRKPTFLLHRF
jgi:hypothetical protein